MRSHLSPTHTSKKKKIAQIHIMDAEQRASLKKRRDEEQPCEIGIHLHVYDSCNPGGDVPQFDIFTSN